ncbi:MAG TPA: RluA family pseudouridine synthase [Planctomycetota bacterium]|nr:RluA family pseudouridine synthase [Planctomycetota bacterium]
MSQAATYAVLHRDPTLLVVDKAPGVLVVPPPGSRERCLLDDLRRDGFKVAPVHRLDRDTSGVLLLCLDPAQRAALEDAFRRHEVTKEYLALVRGVPPTKRATIDIPILDQGATARVDRRGRRAVTHYEVLRTLPGRSAGGTASLVRLSLESGRHNQVRVHMAHIGHPLLGDSKYGRRDRDGAAFQPGRCLLHAERLGLRHPATGRPLEVTAPLPADMEEALAALAV